MVVKAMKHRPWLKYVRWFGYFASVVVVLQLLFIAYLGVSNWMMREERREYTRMHPGPSANRLGRYRGDASDIALLNRLPPLSALAPDGFRLIAVPSFGDTDFAISLHRTQAGAEGVMAMVPREAGGGPVQNVPIRFGPAAYGKLTADLDALASSWNGEANFGTDGTGIVFERVRKDGVTSGFGNSPDFYGKVGAVVFDAIRPTTPQLARFDKSWHPVEP